MATCPLQAAATWQGDNTGVVGCHGIAPRIPYPVKNAFGEPNCWDRKNLKKKERSNPRSVPHLSLSEDTYQLKSTSKLEVAKSYLHRGRTSTQILSSLKPPQEEEQQEAATEEMDPVSPSTPDYSSKEAEEEKIIKVEKKGFVGQVQSFFAWIGAWPSIPSKVSIICYFFTQVSCHGGFQFPKIKKDDSNVVSGVNYGDASYLSWFRSSSMM